MGYTKPLPPLEHLKNWFVYDPEEGTLFSKSSQKYINSVEVRLPHPTNPKYKRRTSVVCYKLAHGVEPKIIKYVDGNLLNWKANNLTDRILTLDQIKEIVNQYDSISDFRLNELGASQQLDKNFKDQREEVFAHLRKPHSFSDTLSRRKELDISDELHESICDYITRVKTEKGEISKKDFTLKQGSPVSLYQIQKTWGSYLFFADEFGIADKWNGSKLTPLTYNDCVKKAEECENLAHFIATYHSVYDYARNRGWLENLIEDAGLSRRVNYREKSDEELVSLGNEWCEEMQCTSPAEFRKRGAGLAAELWRRQLIRSIKLLEFGIYYPPGTTKYTLEEIKEAAESCASISEFQYLHSGMYSTVRRQGWYDEVFENVGRVFTRPNVLYFWNCLEIPNVWKIGISNDNSILGRYRLRWRRRVVDVAMSGDLTPDQVYHCILDDPRTVEQTIISTYTSFTWNKPFDGSTEFLELTPAESQSIINQYFSNTN